MPEQIDERKVFSLSDITRSIQKTISEKYPVSYWIKAEMVKLHYYPKSGHCYPELVEKREGKVVAQMRGILWKDEYKRINEKFRKILKEPIKEGVQILFSARISFDPSFGLSLMITDIDPGFSLGELEREKRETIDRLVKEGIINKNKELKLALLPQRIAVVSVETSKGYADFLKVAEENEWGYKIFHFLFPAVLQGDKAITSMIYQLRRIKKVINHFDAVAIIRGGGGDVGLSCYNNYELSRQIALFPLPVITGIGHSTNETVVEMISFRNAITPTDLGNYLLQKYHNFSVPVQEGERKLQENAKRKIKQEGDKLQNTGKYFRSVTDNLLIRHQNAVTVHIKTIMQQTRHFIRRVNEENTSILAELKRQSTTFIKNEKTGLSSIEKIADNMNPVNVLRRGYSITLKNGKAVKSHKDLEEGDLLKTIIFEGSLESKVKSINKSDTI